MNNKRMFWRIYLAFLLVIGLFATAVGTFTPRSLARYYRGEEAAALESMARLVERQVTDFVARNGSTAGLEQLVTELGRSARLRITIIRPDGVVLADSEENPAIMENHADRPEIRAALAGRALPGGEVRHSNTLGVDMLYTAEVVRRDGQALWVVRTAQPIKAVDAAIDLLLRSLWQGVLVAAVIAGLVGLYFSRRISRPIQTIQRLAERYAKGDFSRRIHLDGPEELTALADSMNRMASQLDERIREVTRERNEREAILTGMREGVLAVDLDERLLMINRAAAAMLGIAGADSVGESIQTVVRNAELQRFLRKVLADESPSDVESQLHAPGGRLLQAESAPLKDEMGAVAGRLIVLSDITRLHHLEDLRREFVANVSHELRTPVTSIKGFIETLRDGAYQDPENARNFLEILARQADRLNSIIEDLLSLSRIERDAESADLSRPGGIEMGATGVRPILEAAAEHYRARLAEKEIRLNLDCPTDLRARANGRLLEQAVGNLLDNAIKYSEPGASIDLLGERAGGEVVIRVRDHGCGIDAKHLPRLFERFYRVDPARSRRLGGTGLGLAIVKHIAQAHRGSVDVESEPGAGSTFTIRLPGPALTES
ncbi:MAG: ATP-binding protein [bacterium]|nr:ATP-binding protein [bacterium]